MSIYDVPNVVEEALLEDIVDYMPLSRKARAGEFLRYDQLSMRVRRAFALEGFLMEASRGRLDDN